MAAAGKLVLSSPGAAFRSGEAWIGKRIDTPVALTTAIKLRHSKGNDSFRRENGWITDHFPALVDGLFVISAKG